LTPITTAILEKSFRDAETCFVTVIGMRIIGTKVIHRMLLALLEMKQHTEQENVSQQYESESRRLVKHVSKHNGDIAVLDGKLEATAEHVVKKGKESEHPVSGTAPRTGQSARGEGGGIPRDHGGAGSE
jgi:hypothetical protein